MLLRDLGDVTIRCKIWMTLGCAMLAFASHAAHAACEFPLQGQGRVSAVLDPRTFRLDDEREVRLAGVEPPGDADAASAAMLGSLIAGREVTLHGSDDRPDRYGRQSAFVFLEGAGTPIQWELLAQGTAFASPILTDKTCYAALLAAEAAARTARRGIWADPAALKNAESRDDILARKGRFAVIEGTVLSARLAGAVFYANFGRQWTRDFAVTISRRRMPAFEAAGIDLKSLKGKRVRVRGWVERRGGPMIEASYPGQIEVIAAMDTIAKAAVPVKEDQ